MNTRISDRIEPNLPGYIIIFETPVSVYTYESGLEMYKVDDPRLLDISLYFDRKMFMEVFNEVFDKALRSNRKVITITYNPVIAKVVGVCIQKYFSDLRDMWRLVSFFHDDANTALVSHTGTENPLEYKTAILTEMLDFPFIDKHEIPYNYVVTSEYLSTLFT